MFACWRLLWCVGGCSYTESTGWLSLICEAVDTGHCVYVCVCFEFFLPPALLGLRGLLLLFRVRPMNLNRTK